MDYQGSGMSVMEMSHRSPEFQKIIDEAEQDLRDLMNIPDNYKVLFLAGRGITAVCNDSHEPDEKQGGRLYCNRTVGQRKHIRKRQKYGKANKIASSEDKTFSYIPDCSRSADISPRCRLCVHLRKQYHLRNKI